MKRQNLLVYALIAAAVAAYVYALRLPAIYYDLGEVLVPRLSPQPAFDTGFDILNQGLWGVFAGQIAWFANLTGLTALALALAGRVPVAAVSMALVSFAIGLDSFFFLRKPLDENNSSVAVHHLGVGFYVWEASFLLLALSQLVAWLIERARARAG